MKKYLQVSMVLFAFAGLVFIKNFKGDDEENIVVGQNMSVSPSSALPTSSPTPSSASSTTNVPVSSSPIPPTPTTAGRYKDGKYTGSPADAYYGNIQVQAIISGGKLTDVIFLQYPNDNHTSLFINSQATGYLKTEALAAQSANVDIVSGASDSSMAFRQSLASALSQAQ